ncbi:MAG: hypothetical protein AB7S78_01590 [Candidatus Omnitrophota bacterium]
MSSDEMMSTLEEIRKIEGAISLYLGHIRNTLNFSGFDKALLNDVEKRLASIHRESQEQNISLKYLIEEIKKGNRNVY